ncbi:hypothetical protein Poli38472_005208 [Pythium oligandrum]|uniref:F-box domain-containing protein n=1 Tax=Pythium oligandrum TaxID=41045 RepID=A0A8K1CG53_PYTOL|nr:hypothetical protein Poli38472_005208 [Pythium oligandrum]|eukprot:TMW62590.1 hypothetical protein Poli38472_005208 [Pythium oligandrum]
MFVDEEYIVDVVPRTPRIPEKLFLRLATVSKSWHAVLRELRHLHDAASLSLDLGPESDDDVATMMTRLECGSHLRTLKLSMGTSHKYLEPFNINLARRTDEELDEIEVDWERVFQMVPKLQRLDLSGVPMHSIHLRKILLAASASCHEMKALVLPQKEWHRGLVTSQWQPTMDTLYTALERWHNSTPVHGLVQLILPQRVVKNDGDQADFHTLTDIYLRSIAQFCPNIEYFDGWKETYAEDSGRIHCRELLYCSQSARESFCQSCTRLREVNWFVLPFIDDFLEVFAANPKPALTKLTLAAGDHEDFPDTTVFGKFYKHGCWKTSVEVVGQVFKCCPNLRELRVVSLPTHDSLQDVVFDDTVLIALAKHCRSLERLEIERLQLPDDDLMRCVTDVGIAAVAPLPGLRSIQLKSTACGVLGVIALLRHDPTEGALREVEVFTGDDYHITSFQAKGVPVDSFHKTAIKLFQELLNEATDFEHRRFRLTICGHVNLRKPETSKNRDTMETLAHEARKALPWLAVSITETKTVTTIVIQSPAHHQPVPHHQSTEPCAFNAWRLSPSEPTGSWKSLGSYLWQVLG